MALAYLPGNLDLEAMLKKSPPPFKFHIDNFHYIISLIYEIPANNKDLLEKNDFVPIHSNELKKMVNSYKKYVSYLINEEVIECDCQYIVEKKSKGYRFNPNYRGEIKWIEIKKRSLLKKLNFVSKYDLKINCKYSKLLQWFNKDLQFNFPLAIKYLKKEYQENIKNGVVNADLKYNAGFINALKLKHHKYFFKVDSNIHRLHTNLTVMKSGLRNCLTYNNQPLVSIDICNSQPYMSSILFSENFYFFEDFGRNNSKSLNIFQLTTSSKSLFKQLLCTKSLENISSYIMSVKASQNNGFHNFINASSNGKLYEFMQQKFEEKGIIVSDRKQLKAMMFIVLFTDNRFLGTPEAEPKRIFKECFPEVYKLFSLIKHSDRTALPRLLQTIESTLMLDRVARRISKEQPEMPIYTIHDSIVCPVGNEEYVAGIIREEAQEAIGLAPSLKFEYWCPKKLF